MATTNYLLDHHQHGFSKQIVFRHSEKTPANYSSRRLLKMLAEHFEAADLEYQVETHHRLGDGFVVDFGMRSAGTVFDRLLHFATYGLELRGWRIEVHRSPVYNEWEKSEFWICFLNWYFLDFIFVLFRAAAFSEHQEDHCV